MSTRSIRRSLGAATRAALLGFAFGSTLLCGAAGCRVAQAVRVNPEQIPERYRVVCTRSFMHCERLAKKTCGDDYVVLNKTSNKPEQPEVQTTGLSSTGPTHGPVNWRGELVVQCGGDLPPIRLVREAEAEQPATASSAGAGESLPRVCVPGETQACLGPGACSGAQVCSDDGTKFGVCDCGPSPGLRQGSPAGQSTANPAVAPAAASPAAQSSAVSPESPPPAAGSSPQTAAGTSSQSPPSAEPNQPAASKAPASP